MRRNHGIACARADYAGARAALPEQHAGICEAVICHDEAVGAAGRFLALGGSRGTTYKHVAAAISESAALVLEVRNRGNVSDRRRSLAATVMAFDERVRARLAE